MFSDAVRTEMTKQGLSQADIAQKIGVTQASLSEMLKNNSMKEARMIEIAEALGFSIEIVWKPLKVDVENEPAELLIGFMVKTMLSATGTTQAVLAEALHTSQGSLGRDLSRDDMKVSRLCTIADILGYSVDMRFINQDSSQILETHLTLDMDESTIKDVVKEMLTLSGMTQTALAEAIGTRQAALSRSLGSGDLKILKLKAIAEALGHTMVVKLTNQSTGQTIEARLKVDCES